MTNFNVNGVDSIRNYTSVKAPVVDRTAEIVAGGLAKGLKGVFDALPTAEDRAKQQKSVMLGSYQSELLKIADAKDQNRLTSAQARTKARALHQQFIANNPSLAKDAADVHSKAVSSAGLGKVIGQKSPVEDAEEKLMGEAVAGGFVFGSMNEEQKRIGLMQYRKHKRSLDELKEEGDRIGLENKKTTGSKAEIELRNAQRKERGVLLLDSISDGVKHRVQSEILDVRARLGAGQISPEEAVATLQELENKWAGEISESARAAGNESINSVLNPIKKMFELERDISSGKISREVAENKQAYYKATITARGLEDPKLQQLFLIGKLLPNADASTYMPQFKAATDILKQNSGSAVKVPYNIWDTNSSNNAAAQKAVTGVIKENINKPTEGDDGVAQKEQVDNNINNLLKGIDVYEKAVESPEEYNQVVDFIASPEYAKWLKSGKADRDSVEGASRVIKERYLSEALPVIEEAWRTPNYSSDKGLAGFKDGKASSVQENMKIEYTEGGLRFSATNDDRMVSGMASHFNKTMAPIVTKIVRATAHLEGHNNYKETFEKVFGKAFDLKKDYDKSELELDQLEDTKEELEGKDSDAILKGSVNSDSLMDAFESIGQLAKKTGDTTPESNGDAAAASIPRILVHEGGYINHHDDPGGPTNKGITLATYRRNINPKGTAEDVKNITTEQAVQIYKKEYWDKPKIGKLPNGVSHAVFDFGVNSGPSQAIKSLQKVLGVEKRTGKLDEATLEAVNMYEPEQLITALNQERLRFVSGLKNARSFLKGWTSRIERVQQEATELARG